LAQYDTEFLLNIFVDDNPKGLYIVGQDGKLKYVNNRVVEWLEVKSGNELLDDSTCGWYADQDDWRNIQVKVIESVEGD